MNSWQWSNSSSLRVAVLPPVSRSIFRAGELPTEGLIGPLFNRPRTRPRPRLPLGWRDGAGWFYRLQFLDCRPPLAATVKDRLRGRARSEDPKKRSFETCHAGSRGSASLPAQVRITSRPPTRITFRAQRYSSNELE